MEESEREFGIRADLPNWTSDIADDKMPTGEIFIRIGSKEHGGYTTLLFGLTLKEIIGGIHSLLKNHRAVVSTDEGGYIVFEQSDSKSVDIWYCTSQDEVEDPTNRVLSPLGNVEKRTLINELDDFCGSWIRQFTQQHPNINESTWLSELAEFDNLYDGELDN